MLFELKNLLMESLIQQNLDSPEVEESSDAMDIWMTANSVNSSYSQEEYDDITYQNVSSLDTSVPVKVYWALLMIPLPLVAVFGNILVILSVYKEKSLQSATNYFIVSLAFADLLVAAVVMPFAVYVLVNVDWELSETLCDFYIALDVTCSTASIFNLVAISIDRFIAVTQPIKYSKHKNHRRVCLTIIIVWLVSAAIGSPIVLGLNTSPERIPNLCVFYNSDFIIYSSLSSFYIPCMVMIYLYYKIFKAIHERTKKAIGQKAASRKAHNTTNSHKETIVEGVPQIEIHEYSKPHVLMLTTKHKTDPSHLEMAISNENGETYILAKKAISLNDIQHSSDDEMHNLAKGSQSTMDLTFGDSPARLIDTNFNTSKSNGTPLSVRAAFLGSKEDNVFLEDLKTETIKQRKKLLFSFVKDKNLKKSHKKRERNAARRERKATKTLAIVLGVFLVCWVPFFTCNILDAICIKLESDSCRPGVTAFLLTTWLGYINSCINPVIYTIFNVEFRKAFKKLLLEPCK